MPSGGPRRPPRRRAEARGDGRGVHARAAPDRHALLMMMQGFAAASDPEIQEHVRRKYGEIIIEVSRALRRPAGRGVAVLRHGMLLNIITALDLPAIADGQPRHRGLGRGAPALMFDALARLADRRRRLVLVVAGVFVVFAAALRRARRQPARLRATTSRTTRPSRCSRATTVERATGPLRVAGHGRRARAQRPSRRRSTASSRRCATRASPRSPRRATAGPPSWSPSDGNSTYVVVTFRADADERDLAESLQERVEREPGVTAGGGVSSRSRRSPSRCRRTSRARRCSRSRCCSCSRSWSSAASSRRCCR